MKMKKLLTFVIAGFFVLSGLGVVAFEPDKSDMEIVEKLVLSWSVCEWIWRDYVGQSYYFHSFGFHILRQTSCLEIDYIQQD